MLKFLAVSSLMISSLAVAKEPVRTPANEYYGECLRWGTQQVCGYKQVCDVMCTAGTGALGALLPGYAVVGAISSVIVDNVLNVCGNVCHPVSDCTDEPMCLEYNYLTSAPEYPSKPE